MKTLAIVLVCVGVLFLQGCTYVPAIEPTDLSTVYENTATRTEIEAALGEPMVSRETKEGSINVYLYDRGAEGEIVSPWVGVSGCGEGCGLAVLLSVPFVWASTPFLYAYKVEEQEGYLVVVYSADDASIRYGTYLAGENIDLLMDREVARLNLETRAKNGDPDEQWELANLRGSQRTKWLCPAAHGGNAEAQFRLGRHYRHGDGGAKADAVAAYLWLSLAETNGFIDKGTAKGSVSYIKTADGAFQCRCGHAKESQAVIEIESIQKDGLSLCNQHCAKETEPKQTQREIVANSMTPNQITDAERLVANWKPNPDECEVEATRLASRETINPTLDDIPAQSDRTLTVAMATPETIQGVGEKWFFEIMEGQSPSSADRQVISIVDNRFKVKISTNGWRGIISGEIDQRGNLAGTGTLYWMGRTPALLNFEVKSSKESFHTNVVATNHWNTPPSFTIHLTRE
jgi:hypothetical protein